MSFMDSSYMTNRSTRNGLGLMLPAIISKTQNSPNVHNKGVLKEDATYRYNIVNGTKSTYQRTSKPETFLRNGTEDFRKTHFMTVQGNGRLGNQMFQFAALLGVSALHNYAPFVAPHHKPMQIFYLAQARVITMVNAHRHREERAGAFDPRIKNLSHSKNWTIQGYFQSWKYFDHVAKDVRNVFRFKADLYQKAFTKLKALNASVTVGVHIRRGDMNSKRGLSRGYNVEEESFIKKALSYFRFKFKNPVFVLIGDDATWMRLKVNYADVKIAPSGNAGADRYVWLVGRLFSGGRDCVLPGLS
ncbi:Galactoside 2-alpha-L-fucosyltransferase 2 [Mizuhopecten yessoensis]|uniref:L-Fucosyltransferase n=1 Tax=Mizuhopecten yessoensis TaxID=6573 RepID=A0A210QXK8_MIZYE|nr:Galactoside 2-alpha-L-fucosyltransferase 2 [Mizuhopecten yessoensis]